MSNGLDPDQDRHSVGPDLGPDYLQRLSAGDFVTASKERVNYQPYPLVSTIQVLNSAIDYPQHRFR